MNRINKIWFTFFGFVIILIGMQMNNFVMAQNEGKMPVKNWNGVESISPFNLHQNLTQETKYPYLSDIIFSWSIGDIITFLGIIPFIIGLFAKESSSEQEKK